ncbi:MAG: ABC transporter permease [Lachnospiraceae bacterium]|nr:ABC transporter permease [Lachnospiraceae bacterium]
MKSNGFWKVFSFNFRDRVANNRYKMSTLIVALLLMVGVFLLDTILSGNAAEKDASVYDVKEVYVLDETGLGIGDYAAYAEYAGYEEAKDTLFTEVTGDVEELLAGDAASGYLFVQKKAEEGYLIDIVTGKDVDASSAVVKKNISILEELAVVGLRNQVLMHSQLTEAQMMQALFPVNTEVVTIGEADNNEMMQVTRNITSTICVVLIYFMVLVYGNSICSAVPSEKTSKLVEQMLMSVSPRSLVGGKILAGIASCTMQMVLWIVCLIGGLVLGEAQVVAKYGLEQGYVTQLLNSISEAFGMNGFSPLRIFLCVVAFLVGMAFYLSLAGLAGATLTRPENAGNVTAIFIFPLIIAYIIMLTVSPISKYTGAFETMPLLYHLIPFTSAMSLPSAILVGELSIPLALLGIVINILFFGVIFWIAGKIYQGLLFFNGAKVGFKDMLAAMKRK